MGNELISFKIIVMICAEHDILQLENNAAR